MRTIMGLAFMFLCLTFSCATNDPGPLPEEPTTEEPATEEVEVVVQERCLDCDYDTRDCYSDCDCPNGTRCNASGSCVTYAVFGPVENAPLCVASCQCWASYCDMSCGSYGYCR
jgi:hypothetical protein